MQISLKEFENNLVAAGFMSKDQFRRFLARVSPKRQGLPLRDVIHELERLGYLTSFQIAKICEGRQSELVLGRYVILDRIGAGGMGEVFKAEHRRMKRSVVLKVLHQRHTQSDQLVRRFQREMEAAAQLNHPNIVTAFDADEHSGIYYLVMEFVDGDNLVTIVNRDGPLGVIRALRYTLQAAEGLAYAHSKGIIHRDIKPSNLLVDRDETLKVLDLGLALFDAAYVPAGSPGDVESLTMADQILGTVDYMSPEQADSTASVDRRSDIYSLGCTLYRILAGQPPFPRDSTIQKLIAHREEQPPSIRILRPDVPSDLDVLIRKMLEKTPEARHSTMKELIVEIESCLATAKTVVPSSDDGPVVSVADHDATVELTEISLEAAGTNSDSETVQCDGQPSLAVGIDLGTSYSVVAFVDKYGSPQVIANAEGDKTTPSVLLFEPDRVVVGIEAAKAMGTDMARIVECPKRTLGYSCANGQLPANQPRPEALQAWILNKLRLDAWKTLGSFRHAVITVPAYFDELRRKATQDAGYMAGFEVLDIVNEPTAAAIAFGFEQGFLHGESDRDHVQRILVYDLGGGTFDVTVIEIQGGEFRTLATDGDVRLGGRDWDQRLVDFVSEEFIRSHGNDPREDPNTLGYLLRECEKAKRSLSARRRTTVVVRHQAQLHAVSVMREDFECMTADLLGRTEFTAEQTLRAANMSWADIDRVLLVGGSTRMPAVGEMVRRISGKAPDYSVSPDEAVALGAALHASWLLERMAGRTPAFRIRNVNSHSLGIVGVDRRTGCSQVAKIIPRNTPLPTTAKRIFSTRKIGQQSVLIQIVEGESHNPKDCIPIGRCVVRGLPPNLPTGTPIEVSFKYETDGRLGVRVRFPGQDPLLQHEISREHNLTAEELSDWRRRVSGLPPLDVQNDNRLKPTEIMSWPVTEGIKAT